MKHTITCLLLICACTLFAQNPRVLSEQSIGHGFYPQINAEGTEVLYLDDESQSYAATHEGSLYVTNEDLNMVLYRNGNRTVLNPRGNDVHYVWSSVSPDGTRLLYHTKYGTEVCDLNGTILANLGMLIDPQWYGNDYVVGSTETSDGHQYLSSCIAIIRADGTGYTQLTRPEQMGMHPTVSPMSGKVVYSTLEGDMYLLQLNLAENPIQYSTPAIKRAPQPMRAPARTQNVTPKAREDLKIYINPGHGGHDSDDRPMYIYPFERNDPESFWESNSNLDKGLRLRDVLTALGVQTKMSRVTNTTEDDLPLSTIVAEANAYNPDFFLSIHSNAGTPSNFILQLYAGKNPGDNRSYANATPCSDEGRAVTTLMGNILYENAVTDWTREPMIQGDKTFAHDVMGWSNGYGVLRGLRVPGTISEGCMHDYIPETYRLMNMGYKWREAFYFARTFMEYYCNYTIPEGAIGGQVRDFYLPLTFPEISYHRGTLDGHKPINRAKVELSRNGALLQTCYTDTLYNGVYFFFDLQPGQYEVKVSADGYYDYTYTETVTAAHISYHNALINLQRATPLEVIAYSPAPADITDSVDVSTNIVLDFNWDCRTDSVQAAFSITPEVEGVISFENDNRRMRFAPAGRFEPGTEYIVKLSTTACHADTAFSNHLTAPFEFRFRTKDRGAIRFLGSYPEDGATDVPLSPSFVTLFDQSIVKSSARGSFVLNDTEGNDIKINTRSYKYNEAPAPYGHVSFETTNELQPATEYILTIKSTLQDNIGVYLVNDRQIRFTTAATATTSTIPMHDALDTLIFVPDRENSISTSSISTLRNTNRKYSGAASNELSYVFTDDDQAEAWYNTKDPAYISTIGAADRLGMYVFSDFSGNTIYLRCEVAGDIQYVKLCDLDYGGWKWQEPDLTVLPKGIEYQLMGLRIVRGSSLLSGKGSVFINDLRYEYNMQSAIEDIQAPAAPVKQLRDGHLFILHGDATYDAAGMQVK